MSDEEDRQTGNRDCDHHRNIQLKSGSGDSHSIGRDNARDSQHTEDIEDVTPHDIADSDVAFSANGGHDRSRKFRH